MNSLITLCGLHVLEQFQGRMMLTPGESSAGHDGAHLESWLAEGATTELSLLSYLVYPLLNTHLHPPRMSHM